MGTNRVDIFITGYYGFRNAGDEAILSALVRDLKKLATGVNITVASGDPAETESSHGITAVPWQDISALEAGIRRADAVLIGGGGLFHDYWPFEPRDMLSRFHGGLSYLGSIAWLASLHQRPLLIRSVGVGPLTTRLGQDHTRAIFEQAWGVSVRDRESLELLAAIGVDTSRCNLGADPAYLLEPVPREHQRRILTTQGIDPSRPRLGVALRSWEFAGPQELWLGELVPALTGWARAHDGEILLVPFQRLPGEFPDDLAVAEALVGLLGPEVPTATLRANLRPEELMAVLGSCQTVVAMRLHAVILAALAGVPAVGIGYDPKVERTMARLGVPELCLPLHELSGTALSRLLERVETERRHVLTAMKKGVAEQRRACNRDGETLALALSGELAPPPAPSAETLDLQRQAIVGLALRADTTYGNNVSLVTERANLVTERDRLAGQRDLLMAERDGLRRQLVERETEVARLRNTLEELRHVQGDLAEAQATVEELRTRVTALEQENARLTWKARGVLGRAMDRLFRPRAEGHFRYWSRSVYYAVAGLLLKIGGKGRRSGRGAGAPDPLYAARFERYLEARRALCGTPADRMICPSEPGLVSIVLPVFNGGDLLEEALDSILAQTYANFELIAIDDGSTDGSAEILDRYALKDPRIRVVHQENQKLPRSLSNGFRLARGQYLTWTSHDNRFKPHFLERMVDCLQRHPDWDMAYANMDIIGDDGLPLMGSGWYFGYQEPRGSQHIHLPAIRGELNTWPNNYVGAAFLYRDRVAALLGDYGADRFTVEDYDYWMQVNELLELHHADFDETLYEYRFHDQSLTIQEDDSRMLALRDRVMVFDDFRRDFALSSMVWILDGFPDGGLGKELATDLRHRMKEAGHLEMALEEINPDELPGLWFPTAYLQWTDAPGDARPPSGRLPRHALRILLTDSADSLPEEVSEEWDLCVTAAPSPAVVRTTGVYQGWYGLGDAAALFAAADIRTRVQQFRALEEEIRRTGDGERLDATVVISTYRRREALEQLLRSLAHQTVPLDRFEVLVVNNDPADDIGPVVTRLRDELFAGHPDHLRLMVCPLKGLSHARNAGIGAARGEVVAFIDDDAVAARDWLERLLGAYQSDPELGVVGGRILLALPDPAPEWLTEEAWPLWGYLNPEPKELYRVDSWADFPWGGNWSARRKLLLEIGGFRYGYGRKGNDFGGGEEIVAASLARKLGAGIAVEPRATIEHRPDRSRFTPEYVRRTIRAGTLVSYYLQRDLYIPKWQRPLDVLEQIGRRMFRIVTGRGASPFRRMEQKARLSADIALFRLMAADARYHARFPS